MPLSQTAFKNPAWKKKPIRTGFRVAATYIRRLHPAFSEVAIPFDEGKSRILADLKTSLGLGLYRYGQQDSDLDFIKTLLNPGDCFIDGGANVGLFSLVAAARVGKDGKVISFEPASTTRKRLEQNRSLNHYDWIEIRSEALSDAPGQADFTVFGGNGSGVSSLAPASRDHGQVERVALTTLDGLINTHGSFLERLRLIKLDLEGAELKALRGARKLLEKYRPHLMIEIEPSHLLRQQSRAEEIFELLEGLGYSRSALRTPNFLFTCEKDAIKGFTP